MDTLPEQNTPAQPKPKNSFLNISKHSKAFTWIVFSLFGLIILIGAFALGVRVGFHEAHFTETWERGYPANAANIGIQAGGLPIKRGPGAPFLNAYGLSGTILTVNGDSLTVKDSDNTEKTVEIEADTSIRQNFTDLKAADLKPNDTVIIIGQPNEQGQIEAKFIRVLNQQ